jgi:hypothetical protein
VRNLNSDFDYYEATGMKNQNEHQHSNVSIHFYFDKLSKGFDNLYREPKDGMISLRRNTAPCYHLSKNGKALPGVELVTLIDVSTLYQEKQLLAG